MDGLLDGDDAAEKAREKVIASPNIQYFVYNNTTLISCVELGTDGCVCVCMCVFSPFPLTCAPRQ